MSKPAAETQMNVLISEEMDRGLAMIEARLKHHPTFKYKMTSQKRGANRKLIVNAMVWAFIELEAGEQDAMIERYIESISPVAAPGEAPRLHRGLVAKGKEKKSGGNKS